MWSYKIIKGKYAYTAFGFMDGVGQGYFERGATEQDLKDYILSQDPDATFL